MAGIKNLKPPTTEQARERGRKGGKASVKAKKERKALKDELLALLSDGDTQGKICLALIRQAQRGNIKAFEVMRDTIGEKPVQQTELIDNGLINEGIITIAELINNPKPNRELPDEQKE